MAQELIVPTQLTLRCCLLTRDVPLMVKQELLVHGLQAHEQLVVPRDLSNVPHRLKVHLLDVDPQLPCYDLRYLVSSPCLNLLRARIALGLLLYFLSHPLK